MRLALLVVALMAWLGGPVSMTAASPLQLGPPPGERPQGGTSGRPAEEPQDGSSSRSAERPRDGSSLGRSRFPVAGSEGAGAIPVPALFKRFTEQITVAQRQLNQTLSREMRHIRQTGSPAAVLTVSLVAFVYGVLHAAGPGHGKLVVSAFFLGREARIIKGVMMGGLVSVLQTFSAIAIVLVLVFILGRGGFDVVQQSVWVEVASYGLIVLIGLYMIYAAVTGRHLGHRHAEHIDGADGDREVHHGVVVAAGLTPCASAIIILLFALANGVLAIGIAATLVMALGMSLTVALVGVSTIVARKTLLGAMASRPRAALWIKRGLTLTGALLITVVGSLFFASAWSRLH
jgi:nickel/cobalt transporter (NicO) family protein